MIEELILYRILCGLLCGFMFGWLRRRVSLGRFSIELLAFAVGIALVIEILELVLA